MKIYKNEEFILYAIVNMENWCTKDVLLELLEKSGNVMTERMFRSLVAYNNILFNEGKRSMYIAHDNEHGYIATQDEKIIRRSIADLKARSYDMLNKARNTEKRLMQLKGETI